MPDSEGLLSERLTQYVTAPNVAFDSPDAEKAYIKRATAIRDATLLVKPPDQVPVAPMVGGFALRNAGHQWKDGLYDVDKLCEAVVQYYTEFQPDMFFGPRNFAPGSMFDLLEYKLYDWPGQKLPDNVSYQANEGEVMTAEDYPKLIADPTGFFIRDYLPRIYPRLKELRLFPNPLHHVEMPWASTWFTPFGQPETRSALEVMMRAGEIAVTFDQKVRQMNQTINALGFPNSTGSVSSAPFDILGDTMRGTKEIFLDIYRRGETVIEACDRLVPLAVSMATDSPGVTETPMAFIPLHKGADIFMSTDQFKTFYWPSLKKLMLGLIENGVIPVLFAEADYTERLEIIADFPKGKSVWIFDKTDMKRAKDVLGDVSCIAGNVPLSLMNMGTADQVEAYCADIIEYCAPGGGFWLTTSGSLEIAKPENVRALIRSVKKYGTR